VKRGDLETTYHIATQGPYHIATLPSNVHVALGDEQSRDLAAVLVVVHDEDVERRVPVHAFCSTCLVVSLVQFNSLSMMLTLMGVSQSMFCSTCLVVSLVQFNSLSWMSPQSTVRIRDHAALIWTSPHAERRTCLCFRYLSPLGPCFSWDSIQGVSGGSGQGVSLFS
jgi:hypothetical protein